jgi:hypothetical protein
MNTNPDDWWLRRRLPPPNPGDAWSGQGGAYRKWIGVGAAGSRLARWCRVSAQVLLLVVAGMPVSWSGNRGSVRVVLGLGAIGLAAIVFLVPLAWAGRLDPCAAAEVALVDEAVGRGSRFEASKARVANWAGADGRLLSHGRVGRRIAAEEHAGWPSFAGCTALFWRVRAEGASFGGFTAVLSRVLSSRR